MGSMGVDARASEFVDPAPVAHVSSPAGVSDLTRVALLEDIDGDGPHAVSAQGTDLVLVRTASGFRAFEGRCPHQGALLGEGEIEGGDLVCRNHRWRFSTDTGARNGGPQCLASCPIIEREGALYVDVSSLQRSAVAQSAAGLSASRRLDDLPGPRGLPLLGNAHQLELSRLHLILERWANIYGPQYVFRMGVRRVLALSDRDSCVQVLRGRPEKFTWHGAMARIFAEVGAAGVGTAEGDAWRPQRKLVMEALAQRHLRGFYPQLRLVGERLQRRWGRFADQGAVLDIVEELKRFTVDVTTLVAFGHDVNTIEQGEDVIQRRLGLIFPEFNRRVFSLLPIWRLIRLPRDRRLERAIAEVRAWLEELVARERARLRAEPELAEKPGNLLQAMLSVHDDQGRPFSEQLIFGNLMTILLGGEDTTANTLAWIIHELCQAPEDVAEVRREADEILGREAVAADFGANQQLAWAGAVMQEALRLHPVGPFMMFDSKVDTSIGDVLVPKGTRVAVLVRPASANEQHFQDPQRFVPRRWLSPAPLVHDSSAHFPFGSGPRMCAGRSLAVLEAKLLVSMLYKNFEVERVGAVDTVHEKFAFAMTPAGLAVRLRRRAMA